MRPIAALNCACDAYSTSPNDPPDKCIFGGRIIFRNQMQGILEGSREPLIVLIFLRDRPIRLSAGLQASNCKLRDEFYFYKKFH